QDPFEGKTLLAVPALRPDVALIHVNLADAQGNGVILGDGHMDALCAKAARRTYLSAEQILLPERLQTYGHDVRILRPLVTEVIVTSVTTLGALAAHLAKNTHAPDLAVLSTPESGMDAIPMPTLSLGQFLTDNQRAIPLTMEDIFDAIFTDRFRIWINPAQIDQAGNVNISVIGPWERPKVALVGSRGIPEDTSHLSQGLYYLTSHSPRTVVS